MFSADYFSEVSSSSHKYFNIFVTTCAELPGIAIAALLIDRLGRKYSQSVMFVGCAVSTLSLLVSNSSLLRLVFSFGGRMFSLGAFSATYAYTPEVYPTTIRTTGLGTCASLAKVASIFTPFVANAMTSSIKIPIFAYGGACIVAAVAALFLPFETKGKPLEDSCYDHVDTKERLQ